MVKTSVYVQLSTTASHSDHQPGNETSHVKDDTYDTNESHRSVILWSYTEDRRPSKLDDINTHTNQLFTWHVSWLTVFKLSGVNAHLPLQSPLPCVYMSCHNAVSSWPYMMQISSCHHQLLVSLAKDTLL